MSCTGLKIQPGMTRRCPPSSAIELRSCGTTVPFAFVPDSPDPRRYLTKLCDQIVCLLSSEHSQAIVWGDEDDEDVSIDSDNDDSGRFYDFVVAKTNDQKENVVARPGFVVHFFVEILSLELTLTLLISEDGFSASCRSTASA
jgi:hypothetical protein